MKQDFVEPYIGYMYTGYNMCLYHDDILSPIAKLLCPMLSEPLVTRYYKIIVTGYKMYNDTLGGKITITMIPYKCALMHDFVVDWVDEDIMNDINYRTCCDRPLYIDDFLKMFKTIGISVTYDSTNSSNTKNRNCREFKYRHLQHDDWLLFNDIQLDDSNIIKFSFDINHKIQKIIYINNVKQISYDKEYNTNIKLVTEMVNNTLHQLLIITNLPLMMIVFYVMSTNITILLEVYYIHIIIDN
jgi:hypothetical protein